VRIFSIRALLRSLPWRTLLTPRQLFVLNKIYIEGYKQIEIAKQLNITPAAINKIKKVGLLAIRQYIEKKESPNDI
ncbi:sigma factor-like helix-turn-helix DNA-binding protein, partial [Leuconostoc falkenbergense]